MRLDKFTNFAIVLAVLLFGVMKIEEYSRTRDEHDSRRTDPMPTKLLGKVLPVWDESHGGYSKTVVLVLSTRCHFCTASVPFYQRLESGAGKARQLGIVAVFLEGRIDGAKYW